MGFGVSELLILLLIVALLFGTKKLRGLGSDVGSAVKGFRSAMKGTDESEKLAETSNEQDAGQVIEGEVQTDQQDNKQG